MILIAVQQGTRWAEVGRYYDWANDPVTGLKKAIAGKKSRSFGSAKVRVR